MTKLLKEMQQRKHSSSQPENFLLDLILVDTSGVQQGFIHILLNKAMLCSIPKQNYPGAFLTNGMVSYPSTFKPNWPEVWLSDSNGKMQGSYVQFIMLPQL
jgi:hypothetical protein